MANAVATTTNAAVAATPKGQQKISAWLGREDVRQKFVAVLDKHADSFISSLLALVNETPQLANIAEPATVMTAALQAATLKLPINKNLGFAHIVPYKGKAQFQMGWKGFVQLAERTGQYKTIHAGVVYEGQVKDIDFITGQIIKGEKISNKVIGYVAYIEMVNGFSKTFYMTKEEMQEHAKKYSQAYAYDLQRGYKNSPWSTNFDAMATKTVLKLLIGKYGIMSVDTQSASLATALAADGAAIGKNGELDYIDNQTVDAVAAEVEANTGTETFGDDAPPIDAHYDEAVTKPKNEATAKSQAAEAPVTDENALEGMAF